MISCLSQLHGKATQKNAPANYRATPAAYRYTTPVISGRQRPHVSARLGLDDSLQMFQSAFVKAY